MMWKSRFVSNFCFVPLSPRFNSGKIHPESVPETFAISIEIIFHGVSPVVNVTVRVM